LPYLSGHEVLAWIRRQKELESLVVIVLTSSNEPSDLSRCYAPGPIPTWSSRPRRNNSKTSRKPSNGTG